MASRKMITAGSGVDDGGDDEYIGSEIHMTENYSPRYSSYRSTNTSTCAQKKQGGGGSKTCRSKHTSSESVANNKKKTTTLKSRRTTTGSESTKANKPIMKASEFPDGTRRKGQDGKYWRVKSNCKGAKHWEPCVPLS